MSNIKERFDNDKQAALNEVDTYIKGQSIPELPDQQTLRSNVMADVKSGNFKKALEDLEELRNAKTGISLTKIEGDKEKGTTGVIIRDARNAKEPPVKSTEAFEMQFLNATRAALDLAKDNPELQTKIQENAVKFMEDFHKNDKSEGKGLSKDEQKKVFEKSNAAIEELGFLMESNGIKGAHKKLNIAKDFQNFKDDHYNTATISSITDKQGNKHTVSETEVAMKGLTDTQKQHYEAIRDGGKTPEWFNALSSTEKDLVKQSADKILAGDVIPTQLRSNTEGMRNAFEKITSAHDGPKGEILHESKHAGTIASLSKDKESRQEIANENVRQAQEWVGKDATLHCNTYNSGPVGAGDDPKIVKSSIKATEATGAKITNTAFNAFRAAGSYANHLDGAKDTLAQLDKAMQGGMAKDQDPALAKVKEEIAKLREAVDKSSIDPGNKENPNLELSTRLSFVTKAIEKVSDDTLKKYGVTKEEMLDMCASGKDRTGLAEHDQSAQAIADKFGMTVKDVDAQLLKGGHTGNQAGSIYAGGATIGAYGTKSENKAGIPASRKEGLNEIIEVSSAGNKIGSPTRLARLKRAITKNIIEPVKNIFTKKNNTQEAQTPQTNSVKPKEKTQNKAEEQTQERTTTHSPATAQIVKAQRDQNQNPPLKENVHPASAQGQGQRRSQTAGIA